MTNLKNLIDFLPFEFKGPGQSRYLLKAGTGEKNTAGTLESRGCRRIVGYTGL